MQFRLRTLLILLALGPPLLAAIWFDWATVAINASFLWCLAALFEFIRINTPRRT
jgi:hypothetical protein